MAFRRLALVFGLFWALPAGAAPNILVINFDDISPAAIAAATTPAIDRLATEGLTVSVVYTSPLCAPSRGAMHTGRYSFRLGAYSANGIDQSAVEFGTGEMLRLAETPYDTHVFGKWGLSPQATGLNSDWYRWDGLMGLGRFAGSSGTGPSAPDHWSQWDRHDVNYDYPQKLITDTTTNNVTTNLLEVPYEEAAAAVLTARQPFYMNVGFFHSREINPDAAGERAIDAPETPNTTCSATATPTQLQNEACQVAMTEHGDTMLDGILDAIETFDPGFQNTVIILLTNDNGDSIRLDSNSPADPCKGSVYECGVIANLILHTPDMPAHLQGTTNSTALAFVGDIFCTTMDYAGVDDSQLPAFFPSIAADSRYNGQRVVRDCLSLRRLVNGQDFPRKYLYADSATERTLRDASYKIIVPTGDTPGDVTTTFFVLPDENSAGTDPGGKEAELAAAMVAIEGGASGAWYMGDAGSGGGGGGGGGGLSAWQDVATSDFGTGDTFDLQNEMPVESYWPLEKPDTSSWTTSDPITCSRSALGTAITNAADNSIIDFPTNCQIAFAPNPEGTIFQQIANDRHGLLLRGNADGLTSIDFSGFADPTLGSDGWNHQGFKLGSTPSVVNTWSWTAGFTADTTTITASTTGISVGDVVRLEINYWWGIEGIGSPTNYFRYFRVEGVTGTTVTLDHPIGFDATGGSYDVGPFSGHQVSLVETGTDDNIATQIGLENITVTHSQPFGVASYNPVVSIDGCFECWIEDFTCPPGWGNQCVQANTGSARTLVRRIVASGQDWHNRCIVDVTALTSGTPATATVDASAGGCNTWCTGLEPGIVFPADFGAPGSAERTALAGKFASCSCSTCTGTSVTLTLKDGEGNDIAGTGFNNPPTGTTWAAQVNAYNIAKFYVQNGASDWQLVDSIGVNPRVWMICQGGANHVIDAYNVTTMDSALNGSRGRFDHGACGFAASIANDYAVGFTTTASSVKGTGIIGRVLAYNRVPKRTTTNVVASCTEGICDEQTDQGGYASDDTILFGNWLSGYTNASYVFAGCDNDDAGGCETPYQKYHPLLLRNVWTGMEMESKVETAANNPSITDRRPSIDASGTASTDNDNVDKAPSGWDGTVWPSGFLFSDYPDWWCEESGSMPMIGAPIDDDNGGSPILADLPARIRLESGTCTPL